MTRQAIENRIAEINTMVELIENLNEENSKLIHQAYADWNEQFANELRLLGFPMINTNVSIDRNYSLKDDTPYNATVYFRANQNVHSDMTVQFCGEQRRVSRMSAGSISISGKKEDMDEHIVEFAAYYQMVAQVTNILQNNVDSLYDLLGTFKLPELKKVLSTRELKEERDRLEQRLKMMALDLQVGAKVEIKEGHGRYVRWYEHTVEKVTEKCVFFTDTWGTRKQVKKSDVVYIVRKPEVKAS